MKQHTFVVGNKPGVVVSCVTGNLTVHPSHEHSVSVHVTDEHEAVSTVQLYIEGDTVFIHDYEGSLELYVPYEKNASAFITLR